jgi:SAM-dependent methyltransferase
MKRIAKPEDGGVIKDVHGPGFVRHRTGRYWIDRTKKLGTVIPNEIILAELHELLDRDFGRSSARRSLLDLGAGTQPYAPLYRKYFDQTVTVDVPHSPHDTSAVDITASADSLPFESESFDFVLCTEVVEHCPDPRRVFQEIARVLKPAGCTFVTTPLMVGLHEEPFDFYRFTPYGLRDLAERAGLTTEYVRPKGGYGPVLMLLLQWPVTKVWQAVQRHTQLPVYHSANPLLYFPVVLPQLMYVWWWKRHRGRSDLRTMSKRLTRTTLGYVAVFRKAP